MIRTPEQYIESLRDGRIIYLNGEKIPDVTKHPLMKGAINNRARSYALAHDPKWRDLITMKRMATESCSCGNSRRHLKTC